MIAQSFREQRFQNMYHARDGLLKEQLDLQLFNREAERIDATTKGHEAFLDYTDLGVSGGAASLSQFQLTEA